MPRIEESIQINRSPQEVWDFTADPANLPVWNGAIQTADPDGPMAQGTKVSGHLKFLGKRMDYVNEITTFNPPTESAYRSVDAPFEFTGGSMLEPADGGTRMTTWIETGSLGGFFGKMGDPIVTKMYARQVRNDLENLKEILEHE
jgi:carbon monoxide dehydrogenase subunit G